MTHACVYHEFKLAADRLVFGVAFPIKVQGVIALTKAEWTNIITKKRLKGAWYHQFPNLTVDPETSYSNEPIQCHTANSMKDYFENKHINTHLCVPDHLTWVQSKYLELDGPENVGCKNYKHGALKTGPHKHLTVHSQRIMHETCREYAETCKNVLQTEIGNPYLWHILGMGMGLPWLAITLEWDCFF